MAVARLSLLLGKVLFPGINPAIKAVPVSVISMKLEPRIHVYYNTEEKYWVSDPEMKCQVGDMVLIRQLDEPLSVDVKHKVQEVVFPVGNIIEPSTGRRCRGVEYIDEDRRSFRTLPTSNS